MIDPTFLTAVRNESTAITPEAEGVLIEVHDDAVRFVLDDGESLTFDASELRTALGEAA